MYIRNHHLVLCCGLSTLCLSACVSNILDELRQDVAVVSDPVGETLPAGVDAGPLRPSDAGTGGSGGAPSTSGGAGGSEVAGGGAHASAGTGGANPSPPAGGAGTGGQPPTGPGGVPGMGGMVEPGGERIPCQPGTFLTDADGEPECRACLDGSFSSGEDSSLCSPFSDCKPGQYVAEPGSAVADRQCLDCPAGQTAGTVNAASCSTAECEPGSALVKTPTGATEAVCMPCSAGSYCPGGTAAETTCPMMTWDHDGDSATACETWSDCSPGQRLEGPGSSATDRQCVDCVDSFSTEDNASDCTPWSECIAGQFVETVGTGETDRECTQCASDAFSSTDNATRCQAHTICSAPAEYQMADGTATSDRECATCPVGMGAAADNGGSCDVAVVAFNMANGEVVIEAESYDRAIAGTLDSWEVAADGSASGGTVVAIEPDDGTEVFEDPTGVGGGLEYYVNFTATGQFHVHLRAYGKHGGSDSVWFGVNGVLLDPLVFYTAPPSWLWVTRVLTIDTVGLYKISLWEREDGVKMDKIVINQSATALSGHGPSQSARY